MVKRRQTSEKQEIQKKIKLAALRQEFFCQELEDIGNMIRIDSIKMTEASKSGHPTSCASLADLLACLFFSPNGLRINLEDLSGYENERLVLSKGHAAPALYSAWCLAGYLEREEIMKLRQIGSRIEGHPMPNMPFVDVATGSLGQGLGVAAGLAYSHQYLDHNDHLAFSIIGDGETQEGSIWEAAHFAGFYQLKHLVCFLDCNRLGQSFVLGDNSSMYQKRFSSFGWDSRVIDGHDMKDIQKALKDARDNQQKSKGRPMMIVCKTLKGKGLGDNVEDILSMHGKPLMGQMAEQAISRIQAQIEDNKVRRPINKAVTSDNQYFKKGHGIQKYQQSMLDDKDEKVYATREIYGMTLKNMGSKEVDTRGQMVVMDADMRNSTFSGEFQKVFPERFVECFIAEQNMVSVGLGVSCRDKVVFISTFAAFLSRAYDQLRMGGVSSSNLKVCGSHVGCSIGEDGTSQMGLEDMAMMRALPGSTVLYPSDKYAMEQAVYLAAQTQGIVYIRSNRAQLKSVYSSDTIFTVGKSMVVKSGQNDKALVVAMGVTLLEALAARDTLINTHNIHIRVIDIFSVKPVDQEGLKKNALECNGNMVVVEDHYQQGGAYEAVSAAMSQIDNVRVHPLCVNRIPKSGKPAELLDFCGISSKHIVNKILSL